MKILPFIKNVKLFHVVKIAYHTKEEWSYYIHLVLIVTAVAQKCSHAEAKRKQKIAELSNSPVKNWNLHQIKVKILWFLSFKSFIEKVR